MLPHPCSARAGRAFKNLQEHVYTRKFTYSRTQTLNHLAGIFAIILMPCVTIKKKSPKTHLSKIASVYFQMKKKKKSPKKYLALNLNFLCSSFCVWNLSKCFGRNRPGRLSNEKSWWCVKVRSEIQRFVWKRLERLLIKPLTRIIYCQISIRNCSVIFGSRLLAHRLPLKRQL